MNLIIAMNIFFKILSWLLNQANRAYKTDQFYAIKNRILKKYGIFLCYDIQFIEGKKCFSCNGTGIHYYYSWETGKPYDSTDCYHCFNGWYKRPTWNILAKIQFGKYTFHQPYQRVYEKPDNTIQIIDGYIDHDWAKHGKFALNVLFLLYEKGYLKCCVINVFNRIKYRIKQLLKIDYKYRIRLIFSNEDTLPF